MELAVLEGADKEESEMRLIDADKLLKKFNIDDITTVGENHHVPILIARKAIEDAPTIIPAAANWTPCADGLPKDATEDDLFRIFVQITTKSGTVRREFTKEASFRCGKWIDQNGFIVGSSRYEPCKETVIAYHRVLPLYRTDKNG